LLLSLTVRCPSSPQMPGRALGRDRPHPQAQPKMVRRIPPTATSRANGRALVLTDRGSGASQHRPSPFSLDSIRRTRPSHGLLPPRASARGLLFETPSFRTWPLEGGRGFLESQIRRWRPEPSCHGSPRRYLHSLRPSPGFSTRAERIHLRVDHPPPLRAPSPEITHVGLSRGPTRGWPPPRAEDLELFKLEHTHGRTNPEESYGAPVFFVVSCLGVGSLFIYCFVFFSVSSVGLFFSLFLFSFFFFFFFFFFCFFLLFFSFSSFFLSFFFSFFCFFFLFFLLVSLRVFLLFGFCFFCGLSFFFVSFFFRVWVGFFFFFFFGFFSFFFSLGGVFFLFWFCVGFVWGCFFWGFFLVCLFLFFFFYLRRAGSPLFRRPGAQFLLKRIYIPTLLTYPPPRQGLEARDGRGPSSTKQGGFSTAARFFLPRSGGRTRDYSLSRGTQATASS